MRTIELKLYTVTVLVSVSGAASCAILILSDIDN